METIEIITDVLLLITVTPNFATTTQIQNCDSVQYVERGKVGTIECSFEEGFFGVYWYNSTDFIDSYPIIYVSDSVKYGTGYTSGEYDIYPNGSLLIRYVTLTHEHPYTVTYVQSLGEKTVIQEIKVFVIVKPALPSPFIHDCDEESNGCFIDVIVPKVLVCSVSGSRPAVELRWMLEKGDEHINITTNSSIMSLEHDVYTTRIITSQNWQNPPSLKLFVCKADGPPKLFLKDESHILIQTENVNVSLVHHKTFTVDRLSTMNLRCTQEHFFYLVWKKSASIKTQTKTLLYAIVSENTMEKVYEDDLYLGENGSLVVPRVDVNHEGEYSCFYSDGITEGVTVYDIIVRVIPVPPFPVVDGCDQQQYCVLEVGSNGSLTCHVTGIRPQVQLKWSTVHETDAGLITFTNQQLEATGAGDTYNIRLSATYEAKPASARKLKIVCTVIGPNTEIFDLTTVVDMLFLNGHQTNGTSQPTQPTTSIVWIVIVVAFLFLVFIAAGFVVKRQVLKRRKSKTDELGTEEMAAMLTSTGIDDKKSSAMERLFVRQLKEKYENLYNAIKPIPQEKDTTFRIHSIFVECDIQFLDSTNAEWKKISTYQNLLDDTRLKSPMCIVEGDPGYGKTMLTLKLAYDWCQSIPTSPLKEVRLLILLPLNQIRTGEGSFYKVIRELLLPKDSTLKEKDIKRLLQTNSSSLLVVLDGFDEYPDRHSKTDMLDIISKEILQDSQVILTTRTGVLPKTYPLQTTRVKLNGLSDESRKHYIRKALVQDNDKSVYDVILLLEECSEVDDLCKVPMCFVMIAHVACKKDNFRLLHSITRLLHFVVSGFYGHMKNEIKDTGTLEQCSLSATDQNELNEMAFKYLRGDSQSKAWMKEEVCKRVGADLYEIYIRIGILVEKEPTMDDSYERAEQFRYQTEVEFYKDVFCYWYAACYVANYFKEHPVANLKELLRPLNPSDLNTVCRFACGLNPACAKEIIHLVKTIKNGDILAILCLSEIKTSFDDVTETIHELCNGSIVISSSDSLFLQRSSINLLNLSQREGVPVKYVILHNCMKTFDLSKGILITKSGLSISSKIQIRWLQIEVGERELPDKEARDILDFAAICPHLQSLWYYGCVPCRSFDPGSSAVLSLKSRKVSVTWRAFEYTPIYNLNFSTGRWENKSDASEPPPSEFDEMLFQRAQRRRKMTEVSYRENAEITREYWRKKAALDEGLF
ncbi:NLR family CARD domain-containing protein 4 [Holothuria leucospilota]|uniref:NLR family CARD domain-containing protein 4 n=1 Tax=Holothuria leucospilota TaxID=206669 RepID=A0A9Q1CU65_HOLLE|nr:NLR family CARD domain-containing protein 4 [Holothuria leucospilota]